MSSFCEYPVVATSLQATVHIVGHSEFLNCGPLKKFLDFAQNRPEFAEIILDFTDCKSIDSTALGLIARTALAVKKTPDRKLILANLNGGPKRAALQLGLGHIATIQAESASRSPFRIEPEEDSDPVDRETIREAHAALVELSPENREIFADVMTFIKTTRTARAGA